jgi:hypothetical protein
VEKIFPHLGKVPSLTLLAAKFPPIVVLINLSTSWRNLILPKEMLMYFPEAVDK